MPQDRSVFMPVVPDEGPFTQFLQPQSQAQQQEPQLGAGAGKALGAAHIGVEFLKGLSEGRIKNFQLKENEKIQKILRLNAFVQDQTSDKDINDDGRNIIKQAYHKALGTDIASQSEAGKGKGKGEDQHTSPAHHFGQIIKDIALGAAGGKLPKGVKDVNPDAVMGEIYGKIYDQNGKVKPEYSVEGAIGQAFSQIQTITKDLAPTTTQEDVLKKISGPLQKIERYSPERANSVRSDILGQYQPAPRVGTPEYNLQRFTQSFAPAPTPPAAAPPSVRASVPFGSAATPMEVPGGVQLGAPSQPASQPGPPPSPQASVSAALSPGQISLAKLSGKEVYEEQQVTYIDKNGKPVTTLAAIVNVPGKGMGVYDLRGTPLPVDISEIRKGSTTAPRATTFSSIRKMKAPKDEILADGTQVKKGQEVEYRVSNEAGSKPEILGLSVDTRRSAAIRPPSPQMQIAARKLKAIEVLDKIFNETTYEPDKKGNSAPYLKYIHDVSIPQYYRHKDPLYDQYEPEINQLLAQMMKQEGISNKGDAITRLKSDANEAKQDHREASMDNQIQGLQDTISGIDQELGLGGTGEETQQAPAPAAEGTPIDDR